MRPVLTYQSGVKSVGGDCPGRFATCGVNWLRLWGERKSLLSSCLEGFMVSSRYWMTKRQMSSDLRGNRKVLVEY